MGRGGVDIGSPLRAESADSGFSEQSESESESSFPGDHLALENEPHRGNLIPTATNTSATRSQQQQQQHARKKTEEANEGISRSPNGSKPARSYEMKKVVEKKFRTRYRSLQEAYENRLHALALQVQHAVNQIQNDTTVFCLQENPLTSEFATIRLGEIVQECFFGEREKYIKVVSDQVAWQASDLRDAQRKLRAVRQREKEMQQRWTQSQRAIQVLQQQLHGQKRIAAQQEEMHHAVRAEKEGIQVELERMKLNVHSFETLQKEYETLQLRTQNERDKEQSAQEQYAKLMQEMESLKAVSVKLEMEKQASDQEIAHVHHLLSLSEAKSRELSDSVRRMQSKDYPSKVARLEAELSHSKRASIALEKENEELKKKYQEFGAQVEVYMNEQSQEKTTVLKRGEEQVKQVQAQLEVIRQQEQEALKAKQLEVIRFADQLKFRQEALTKAEQKIVVLEKRVSTAETQMTDEKLRSATHVSKLEKEIAHWRHAIEKEKGKALAAEKAGEQILSEAKEKYEAKIALLHESIEKRTLQNVKEKETEARTRWQNDFVAKHEARIEALKAKYDAALESQQAELLRARQQALDSAAAITAKYEATKRSQREEEESDRKRRADASARERAIQEDERAREFARNRMQFEFEEREKRLLEREKHLAEKERKGERRKTEAAQKNASSPSVVVLNVHSAEDDSEPGGNNTGNAEQGGSISKAQHLAELQAREAQITLQSEERLQKALLELQSKKEKEFRAAMVNVRKGIQKLELAVDDAKRERKRIEQEALSERQAFVVVKQELDDATEAKHTVVQRLEEANDNIGKLRRVIKESEGKCQRLEQQVKEAHQTEETSLAAADKARQSSSELRDQLQLLATLKEHQEAELQSTRDMQKQLQARVHQLQEELQKSTEDFLAEKAAFGARNQQEIHTASSQFDHQLRQVEAKESELRQLLDGAEEKMNSLENKVRELEQEKAAQASVLQQMKLDRSQQRKEFSNLTRIHKNLSETMKTRIGEELSERHKVESLLHAAEKEIKSVKLHKERVLLVYKMHLGHLRTELIEMRKAFKNEMKTTLRSLEKDMQAIGGDYEKRAASMLQDKINAFQKQFDVERRQWEQKLQQNNKEISSVLGDQRVNDQLKYDEVVQRLEAKTHALKEIEVQLKDQKDVTTTLQLTVHKMETDSERYRMEQSHLHDRLSISKITTERDAEESVRVQALLERRTKVCQIFHNFVMSMIKAHKLDPPGIVLREVDASWQEKWEEQQLTVELDRVAELLYESSQQAILRAKEEGTEAVLNELESAKKALHSLWSQVDPERDGGVYQHLPWYLIANRAIKQLRDEAERETASLKLEVSAKDAQIQELRQRKLQLQEANNVLRFEKEAVAREMTLLSQTSAKKREQELQELRLDFERKIEQTKHHYGKEQMKADQEYQTAIDHLREALEVERRTTSSMKSQAMAYQMEMEKMQEELKDKNTRLEKEIDEIRDTAVKWKRKAKLAVTSTTSSVGANTPTRAHFLMSASSHDTEEDSDTSFRVIYPPPRTPRTPRRPSSAIADLSSLMEESLHSLRKDSLSSHNSFHFDR